MSSVHRHENRACLYCAYYDPEGYRRLRTTGVEDKQVARIICTAIERASKLAKMGKLSNEKALREVGVLRKAVEDTHGKILADRAEIAFRSVIEEFVKLAGGELTRYTIASWLESWLASHTSASKATLVEYRRIVALFIKFLGAKAGRALSTLHPSEVEAFKVSLIDRVGASTVNKAIKVLKAAFGNAVKKRQLEFSPAEHIEFIETETAGKRRFTDAELKALWKVATGDWLTMLYLGRYTGQRLNDCACLTFENADLLKQVTGLTTQKTGAELNIPMHPELHRHLSTLAGDNPSAPLCPTLTGKKSSWLSAQFHKLMVAAGIAEKRTHEKKKDGKGRDAKREAPKISFHSLRYNAHTELLEAGVPPAVVDKIIGHESRVVSRGYDSFDEETTRKAVNKMREV